MSQHKYLIKRLMDAEERLIAANKEAQAADDRRRAAEKVAAAEAQSLRGFYGEKVESAREAAGIDPEKVRYFG